MPENKAFLDDSHKRKVTKNKLFFGNLGCTRSGLHGREASGCHMPTHYTGNNCQMKLATQRSDPVLCDLLSHMCRLQVPANRKIVIKIIGGPETL